ncbi:DNA translocase FtsK [bacterium]|nr:DNA translocase FtsK [bacterium]
MPSRSRSEQSAVITNDEMPTPRLDSSLLRREVAGTVLVLAGIFIFVSLLVGGDGRSLVGPVGEMISAALTMFFGVPMSFGVPAVLVWLGIRTFRGLKAKWPGARALGVALVIMAINGLLALPGADNPELSQETFRRAGALGCFLVEWEGLRMVGQFGVVGAALILSGMTLVGLVLMTNLGLSALAAMVLRRTRGMEPVPADGIIEDEEEEAVETPRVKQPSRVGLWLKNALRRREKPATERRMTLLGELDEPTGWDDPADDDVAAAARALEAHDLELRLQRRLRSRVVEEDIEEDYEEDYADEYDDEYEELPDEEEDFEDDEAAELEDEEEAEEEILFEDNSKPLPIREGNPMQEKSPALGAGLAKLFPTRWEDEGVPAGSRKKNEEETEEDIRSKAEERLLRQTRENDETPTEDDPLFNEEFDTRPHGPNGQPLEGEQLEMELSRTPREYHLPEIQLLADPPVVDHRMSREEVYELSSTLTETLSHFGVEGRVTQVKQGPVVTRFEFKPAAGIKISRITGLEHDIAMAMKALSVRILAPIPGKSVVGIEVPNKKRAGVYLKELISCEDFWEHQSPLAFALGKTIDGAPYFADLKKMPHLLIAGATGAGKSVCLNTIIASFLYRQPPDRVKLIMVDPKRVELSVYGDIPHLLAPVVCEPKCAAAALDWAVEQMEERYKRLVELGVRNIDGYNKIVEDPEGHPKLKGRKLQPMPYMVVIVDELADLMIIAKADVEESIQRLAQMSRAVGIHLILATQRPSVNVITGIIKANFPSRIAFQVSQKVDSRTILDMNGAESLLGRGDMLFHGGGMPKPIRIQGCFVSDDEVERIADCVRTQCPAEYEIEEFEPKLSEKEQRELARMMGNPDGMDDLDAQDRMVRGTNRVMGKVHAGMFMPHQGGSARAGDEEIDEALVRAAARLILEARKASVSLIQRRLKVGFARAGRLMDMLEEMGIVGEFKGSKPRDIIVDCDAAIEELDKLEHALERGEPIPEALEEEDEYEEEDLEDDEEYYGPEDEDVEGIGDPNRPWPKQRR